MPLGRSAADPGHSVARQVLPGTSCSRYANAARTILELFRRVGLKSAWHELRDLPTRVAFPDYPGKRKPEGFCTTGVASLAIGMGVCHLCFPLGDGFPQAVRG